MSNLGGGVTSGHHPLNPLPQSEGKRLYSLHTLFPHLGCAEQESSDLPGGGCLAAEPSQPEPGTTLPPPPSGPLTFVFLLLFQPGLRHRTPSMQLHGKQRKSSTPYLPPRIPPSTETLWEKPEQGCDRKQVGSNACWEKELLRKSRSGP